MTLAVVLTGSVASPAVALTALVALALTHRRTTTRPHPWGRRHRRARRPSQHPLNRHTRLAAKVTNFSEVLTDA